jgi:hypothetical protein
MRHFERCRCEIDFGSDTLDLELFVRVNSKWFHEEEEKNLSSQRKKRKVVTTKKHQETTASVHIVREEELIPTKCIPVLTEGMDLEEFQKLILSCESRGDLFKSEGYTVNAIQLLGWRCASLSLFILWGMLRPPSRG